MKNMLLVLFALFSFTSSLHAQSCCNSNSKEKKSCAKEVDLVSSIDEQVAITKVDSVQRVDVKTEQFKVYGNCGMCKRAIEGSLKDVDGVTLADWSKETDQMTVTFNPEKITLDAIKQKIADVGYDSDTHRAKDEVYNSLPGCCQYDRPTN
jgi:copper chaperone CopZ